MSYLREDEMLKVIDIRKKLEIVKNVVVACHADKQNKYSHLADCENSMVIENAIRHYTGLDVQIIGTYIKRYMKKTSSDRNAIIWNLKHFLSNVTSNMYDDKFREKIMTMYLNETKVPTISTIKAIDNFLPGKSNSDDKVLMHLRTKNYIQQKIEGTSKAIIIEIPEKTFERFRYLEAMKLMRSSGFNIVYIIQNKLETNWTKQWDYVAITTTNTNVGVLSKFRCGASKFQYRFTLTTIEKWIILSVLPQLLSPSVIVLDDSFDKQIFTKIPTINSTKQEMIKWLTINDIPHRPNQHRAELYEIIKRSKRHFPDKINSFDNVVNAKGHKVLRQPKGVDCLNYFNKVWPDLNKGVTKDYFVKANTCDMLNKPLKYWVQLEKSLINVENKIYNEDLEMENVIDKLLTLGKYYPSGANLFEQCDEVSNLTKVLEVIEM